MNKTTLKEILEKHKNEIIVIDIFELPYKDKCETYAIIENFEDYETFEDIIEDIENGIIGNIMASELIIAYDGKNKKVEIVGGYTDNFNEIMKKYGNKCLEIDTDWID